MFENIGFGEVLVLLIAGLFILGPERLPEAAASVGRWIRKAREFATGARDQLRQEIGPEFDEFRKPIEELGKLRGMTATGLISKHFLDEPSPNGDAGLKPSGYPLTSNPQEQKPLTPGERPPFDPDAT